MIPYVVVDGKVIFYKKPKDGEIQEFLAKSKMIWGINPDRYTYENGTVTPVDASVVQQQEEDKTAAAQKTAARAAIVSQYEIDSEAPVEVAVDEGTFIFNGGQDSASYIQGAVTLAQTLGEETVDITDIDNVRRTLSFESASTVAVMIGVSFRNAFFAKQDALVNL